MDNFLYFIIPVSLFAFYFLLKSACRHYLGRKTDIRSQIKAEAQEMHYEEDRNNRFFKNEDPSFLWKPSSDDGIRRKLKCQIIDKEEHK